MTEYIEREAAIENAISQMRVSKSELCMCERLLNIPTADVRPVVRGKWIEETHTWSNGLRCSECGRKIFCGTTNFCPNCGAKMEES